MAANIEAGAINMENINKARKAYRSLA